MIRRFGKQERLTKSDDETQGASIEGCKRSKRTRTQIGANARKKKELSIVKKQRHKVAAVFGLGDRGRRQMQETRFAKEK